jgi:hypothetical protein
MICDSPRCEIILCRICEPTWVECQRCYEVYCHECSCDLMNRCEGTNCSRANCKEGCSEAFEDPECVTEMFGFAFCGECREGKEFTTYAELKARVDRGEFK